MIAFLLKLLPWIGRNWLPIAVVVGLAAAGIAGYGMGAETERQKCRDDAAELLAHAQRQRDDDQRAANDRSAELEKTLASQRAIVQQLNRRLRDELSNDVYDKCALPVTGLRLNNDARRPNHPAR